MNAVAIERTTRGLTIALCFAVAVVEGFDIQALGIAAPKLAPEFKLASDQMAVLFAISNFGLVFGASIGGWLADRVGRKPVFIGAVLTFGVFTLCTAIARNYDMLLGSRLLAGFGFGAALPNMMAVAAEVSAPNRRSLTASMMFCGMPFGGGSSALLTQALPKDFDWRIIFVIGGVLPLVLAVTLYFLMTETLDRGKHAERPKVDIPKALFGDGRATPTLLLWITFLPTLFILYLILNWLPTLVIANGLDRAVAPQASLAFNYASVAGALIFGVMVDKFGARWPLAFAYAGLIVSLVALGGAHDYVRIVFFSGAAGVFLMGANYSLYGVAASYYPTNVRGTGSGASVAVGRIGSILGPLLAGVMLTGGSSATDVVQYMAPLAAAAGIAVFVLSFFPRSE